VLFTDGEKGKTYFRKFSKRTRNNTKNQDQKGGPERNLRLMNSMHIEHKSFQIPRRKRNLHDNKVTILDDHGKVSIFQRDNPIRYRDERYHLDNMLPSEIMHARAR